MPFNIFADEGPAEEVFERTENVNSDSIIFAFLQSSVYIAA